MAIHHYAVMDGDTIANVVVIDDEAEGWDHGEEGKWEPWGHDRARAEGYVLLHPQPPFVGWKTTDGGKTFVHPENPRQVFTAHEPLNDHPDFVQPTG